VAKTYGWLRSLLADQGIQLDRPAADDDTIIVEHALGGRADPDKLASVVGRIDLAAALQPTGNPELARRRVALGLASMVDREIAAAAVGATSEPPAGGHPAGLDWRNRFGGNWITTVRDQNPCNSCWAFAGTALVESMVKIEHAYWTRLSEGDLHDGIGAKCADENNLGNVSSFLAANGLADRGCWPWHTDDAPYAPTPDRNGRSVRMPAVTWIGDIGQQKDWLDTTGPIATFFEVWSDFYGYTGGYVYRRSTDPSNVDEGGHLMLVVGYDDAQNAWICKNSWGSGWGDGGYVLVGYGEAQVDTYSKAGLSGLNPDPWTKRRLHSGNLYESGNGALNRNLEMLTASGGPVTHYWREGGSPWTWKVATQFGNDAAVCPSITGTTFNRNMETVYLTDNGQLHHWWVAGGGGTWNDGGVFGPTDCQGVPGFIQGDYGAPGNFEVVVLVGGGQLQHLWRDSSFAWHEGPRFGANVELSGAALVQGDYYGNDHGNLECVATLNTGQLQHFWRDEPTQTWNPGVTFGSGIYSTPVMIQGQYGMGSEAGPHGNFELCVAIGNQVQHWWRDNAGGSMAWNNSATFGHDVRAVAGLAEGSWGMNLELTVLRTDNQLQHYFRDSRGWQEGPIIGPA
jgi:Papain family cysteine protease